MEPLPVYKHLQELRNRFLIYSAFLVMTSIVGWFLKDLLLTIITDPLGKPLYYSTPGGSLSFFMKISILFGFFVSMPLIIYETWAFLSPAIGKLNSNFLRNLFLASIALFVLGGAFSYFFVMPATLKLFASFERTSILPIISQDAYFSFVSTYILVFGLIFLIPTVASLLSKSGLINRGHIKKALPHALLSSFVLGALISPTSDPINQSLVAMPMFLLFAVSWFIVKEGRRLDVDFSKLRRIA